RVHAHGAKLAVQLQHASKVAQEDVKAGRPMWVPSIPEPKMGDLIADLSPAEIGKVTSAYASPTSSVAYREMTAEDIAYLVGRFAEAAERAQRAGADAVELHAGHGYMLSAFLSPASNRRSDGYGGAIENRARFLVEALRAVREQVGPELAVWCRIDGCEFHTEGGISLSDAQRTAELAEEAGADAIHVSAYADPTSSAAFTDAPLVHQPSGYLAMAEAIKKRVGIPVIAVGRITPDAGEEALRAGRMDFVAMGRALLADPELPNKLAAGATETIRPCVYAYQCVGNVFLREASRCMINPELGREEELSICPAASVRRIAVVGGGPIGLDFARRAALRGHEVHLFERSSELGGRGRLAAHLSEETAEWLRWLANATRAAGVRIETGRELTPEELRSLGPDELIVATGADREIELARGVDAPEVWPAESLEEVLGRPAKRIAVLGEDIIAVKAAEALVGAGHSVVLLGNAPERAWAPQVGLPRRWRALHALREASAELFLDAGAIHAEQGAVHFTPASGAPEQRSVEGILVANGLVASDEIAKGFEAAGFNARRLGDCQGPIYLQRGLLEAARLAQAL
ncbi:MAG: FAD-dependent oxidoreductase, partial [Deltaproteobacteria bacterium]|nr:FAD-dependent oxidoreductase [Deltaproteobacteria bacterium]